MAGRGSRNSAGLRLANLNAESAVSPSVEQRPYSELTFLAKARSSANDTPVVTDKYILKKYSGNPPSLVVHMHPTHFRFDQQDGMFPYKSPMKLFLEHLRSRTIPHDMLEYFTQWGVPFYEGCLIIQVHDHKSVAQSKDVARPTSSSSNVQPFSIHNYNPYLTPSPYVPYPKDGMVSAADQADAVDAESKEKTADEKDKENMPAPSLPGEGQRSKAPPKPRISTVVLRPTPQCLQMDLYIKTCTPRGSQDGANGLIPPSTPMALVPPTPTTATMQPPANAKKQKRDHMELDSSNIYAAESQIILATTAPLDLEPTKNIEETILKLESLAHPEHSQQPPEPKTRKRTVAEMAADEALAAENERYMLTMDERLSSNAGGAQGGANGADGDGQAGAAAFEPRFERFKKIEDIKREHAERKEQEKIKQAENERKLALQKQQQAQHAAEQAAQLAQQTRQAEERARREQAQQAQQERARHEQQARQQESQRRQLAAQAQAQAQQQAQAQAQAAAQQNQAAMGQTPHAHPGQLPNGMQATPNGMSAQAQARFHQQVSQPTVSSPIVRQNTPQNMSSPMVGGVAMQHSGSNMGGSPPRPSSVVQGHAMGAPMAVSMSARGSQQSHPAGTPRLPVSTPQMSQATPISRPQMVQTPRMSQASPPPNMMVNAQQMGQAMLMNNPGMQQIPNQMMAAQIAAQQQQRIQQQQQMAAAMQQQQNGMMNGMPNQMTQQMLQQRLMQQQQQQMMRNNMANNMANNNPQSQAQLAQRYAQQLNNMQQMQQMQAAGQMQNQMQQRMAAAGQGFVNVNGTQMAPQQAAQMMALQQMQQQQQQQQQQMAQQQMNPQLGTQIQMQSRKLYQQNLPGFIQRNGGVPENIPPEMMENFKRECMNTAKNMVTQMLAQRRAQAVMIQQQQQAMRGMGGGMMPQGM